MTQMIASNPTCSRRNFLKATALGAVGASLAPSALLSDTRAQSLKKYGGFPMGLQSYSLRAFGVDGALERIQQLELHHVEFFRMHYPPTPDPAKIKEMGAKLLKHDISIAAHGVQSFNANERDARNFFTFARMAGIKNISANPNNEAFPILHDLVQEFDIRIAIHNHGPGATYDGAQQTFEAVQKWDKRIGFCADLGHFIRSGEDPVAVVNLLGERLYGIHLKDFAEKKKQTHGVIIGKGHLDVAGVFSAMRKVGFPQDGALSLEYEENKDAPMDDIRACLEVAAKAAQSSLKG